MRRPWMLVVPAAIALLVGACTNSGPGEAAQGPSPTSNIGSGQAVAFKEAKLIVEINATDGDAGFQLFLDHEPWRSIQITGPDGSKIVDIQTQGVLVDYGLTELFWESSEPPFTKFPLEEFTQLFPEGEYTFEGETIDGVRMRSSVPLSHDFPAGPEILSPKEDATVPVEGFVVRWAPASQPDGVEIVAYEVLVVREKGPSQEVTADLPVTATQFVVPAGFLRAGVEYKAEVLAIEASGNQTLTEVPFSTR